MRRGMPTRRLKYIEWLDISDFANQAHSLATLLDLDQGNCISDERLRANVIGGATRALSGILDILVSKLDDIEPRSRHH